MNRKKIGLLHGAILNSGDFLIFHRGKQLLQEYLSSEYELVDIRRWEPFSEELDALVILGGPIISRGLHKQSKNIKDHLKKDVPVVCLGLGVSGERYSVEEDYFTRESAEFWKRVYESSHLFSVRDKKTQRILSHYGIDAEFTGCPALYDLDMIKNRRLTREYVPTMEYVPDETPLNRKVAVTIPHIRLEKNPIYILIGIRNFIYTLLFIRQLKTIKCSSDPINHDSQSKQGNITPDNKTPDNKNSDNKNSDNKTPDLLLILQHGYTPPLRLIGRYAEHSGFRVLDTSYRGLDEVEELRDASFHIGTRLHCHMFFLSLGKPSYLLSVDNRTRAFLGNFQVESENYSPGGIRRLITRFKEELDNPDAQEIMVRMLSTEIMTLFGDMEDFLIRVDEFLKENLKNS